MISKNGKPNQPFFSIVLPIYNVEKYLDRCIKSILNQKFDDYEIILINDGSKDNSPQICENWKKKDFRIKVIHKENAGLSFARNAGLEVASGKYIFFIDSDDYILPNTFERIWEVITNYKVDAVFYGFERRDKNGNLLFELRPNPEKQFYSSTDEIKNKLLPDFIARNPYSGIFRNLQVSAWNCCLNLKFLKENNLKFVSEREYISEDVYFYIELFTKLKNVYILNEVFYCYCQNEESLSFSYRKDRFKRLKDFYIKMDKKANLLNYDGEVQLRLKGQFIANVMSCLKMEAFNYKKIGIIESFNRVKSISIDSYFMKVVKEYPLEKYGIGWNIFAKCINGKYHIVLYIILLLKHYTKGV